MTLSASVPRYWQLLLDPEVRTVLITGCGGGFDFVHCMTVLPELLSHGKDVVIGSYSFGDPLAIGGAHPVWKHRTPDGDVHVVKVNSSCVPDRNYGPEVGLCAFLDETYPRADGTPWSIYAYYARSFTPAMLTNLYTRMCNEHDVDAVLAMDGGSDSLFRGNEEGCGDPVEDTVTVMAIAALSAAGDAPTDGMTEDTVTDARVPRPLRLARDVFCKVLISIGFGCDRFNGCSDAASIRAIAELTAMRTDAMGSPSLIAQSAAQRPREAGFLGSMSLDPLSPLATSYAACITYLQERASFRSVIANSIVETAVNGSFGSTEVPRSLQRRVRPGELFLWPLMAMHWAFAIPCVAERSLLAPLLLPCATEGEMLTVLMKFRNTVERRADGDLPP